MKTLNIDLLNSISVVVLLACQFGLRSDKKTHHCVRETRRESPSEQMLEFDKYKLDTLLDAYE